MKLLAGTVLLAGWLGCSLTPAAGGDSAAPIPKTVLRLFPYRHDQIMHLLALQTLGEEWAGAKDLTLDLYDEFLDLNRFSEDAAQRRLFEFYAAKYHDKPIDLVVVQTEVMLQLWLKHRAAIAPHAPVVFFDSVIDPSARKLPPGVTGVSGTVDLSKSIEWIMRVRPAINEVVLVQGVGAFDQEAENRRPVDAFLQKMSGKVRVTDLSRFPLAEIKRRVAGLPGTSVVLYNMMFEDAAGVKYRPADVTRELALASAVPLISPYDVVIGSGTIGGYVYSIEAQARAAARSGLRILRGEPAESIPSIHGGKECFIFDHRALQRFGLPLSALPPDSILQYRQYSFWDLYRTRIILALLGVVVLLSLVVYLLGVTRRLTRTRGALAHLNARLETQVQERTAALRQTNARLQAELTERQQAQEELARSTETRLEQQARLLTLEEERKYARRQQHLIRDLHDGLGTISANVGLLAARADKETQPSAREHLLATIGRLAAEGGQEVRQLMNTLEARDMPWGNVIHDLRRYAALVLDAAGLQWELVVAGDLPSSGPGPLAGLSLLRIFREAINNTLKHAQARSLRLRIEFVAERCWIEIQDDGKGFPVATAQAGRGLKNMRYRIGELGGSMRVEVASGTRLSFDLPLPVSLVEQEP